MCSLIISKRDIVNVYTSKGAKFYSHNNTAKRFYFTACLILIIVAGFRYYVGTDFGGYFKYERYALDLERSIAENDEPGVRIISWVIGNLTHSGSWVIFTEAAITLSITFIALYKNSDNLGLALILILLLGFWHVSFNAVRQTLAASILFAAFPHIRARRPVRYLIYILIASLFHHSSLLLIALYPIAISKTNVRNLLIIFSASIIILFSYDKIFSVSEALIGEYGDSHDTEYANRAVNILRVFVGASPLVLFWPICHSIIPKDERVYLNMLIANAAIAIMASQSALLYRMTIYSIPFSALSISQLTKYIKKKNRSLVVVSMILLYATYWFYEIFNSNTLNNFQWSFGK